MEMNFQANQAIFIDTLPLIYFWSKHEKYHPAMAALFDKVYEHNVQCIVSLLSYTDITTYLTSENNGTLAAKCRNYLTNSQNISLICPNTTIADRASSFCNKHKLNASDAMKLATAEICGADFVITHDPGWKIVKTQKVILLDDLLSE